MIQKQFTTGIPVRSLPRFFIYACRCRFQLSVDYIVLLMHSQTSTHIQFHTCKIFIINGQTEELSSSDFNLTYFKPKAIYRGLTEAVFDVTALIAALSILDHQPPDGAVDVAQEGQGREEGGSLIVLVHQGEAVESPHFLRIILDLLEGVTVKIKQT